ncbi:MULTISPECIES: hypothetical protein [unclassified Vibrio]|uniref:hypothetical protein n=1 Tax=unclassified Vibrio TaxID=2614977 RepID=UPI00159DF95F|nr:MULTISPECIES: hypothetical protein [unclassified Vibrio]NVN84272.1 hypothetical protein [Vibrio sp. Scap16]QLE93600.1 hypothetical protein FLM53_11490 [Vibrio sp. Scap24]
MMMLRNQRGVVTLLITSVLLIGALVVTLGSYRSVFHQIKVAQNEVEGRKAHWRSEGGLECTYSYLLELNKTIPDIKDSSTRPADFADWCSPYTGQPKVEISDSVSSNAYIVTSSMDTHSLYKTIKESSLLGSGAIQSTGPIELIGTLSLKPTAKEDPIDGNEYECVSVTFADLFTYQYDATHSNSGQALGLEVLDPSADGPFSGFDGICHSDYKTAIPKGTSGSSHSIYAPDYYEKANPPPFQKDFNPDPNMNPFYTFFGVAKTDQNIVDLSQDADLFKHVQLLNATDCGTEIMDHFTAGQSKGLWIEGNCHINAAVAATINPSQLLVVQDGVFALNGAMAYNGVIYHLVDYQKSHVKTRVDDFWKGLVANNVFAPFIKDIDDVNVIKKSVGIQFASGLPSGGLIFDSPLGVTTIVGDMDLDFRSESNPSDPPSIYQWKRGSWNDF